MKIKKKEVLPFEFVVKSNALVGARYRLSLQESHVILWLLTQIKPDDEDFKIHKMDIAEFSKMIGVEVDNQYSKLRLVTRSLMRRVLDIYEPEKQEWLQVAWLSSARYQKKKGAISLKFDPDLKPYLLQLKSHFTKINIVDTLKLKSIHAVRIFELLLQHVTIGERKISINDIRTYCGIKQNEYKNYFDLKLKIIERAKTEINAKTDYDVDYAEIKESRKVVAIEWIIKKKNPQKEEHSQKLMTLQKELRSELALIEALMEYGFSKGIAKRLLKTHEEEVIKNALKSVNLQIERNHVKNAKAMLQTAIKEKWHPEVFKKKKTSP
jgi:plasmid replication initiation protein